MYTTLMCCTCIVCSRCFIFLCSERSSWSTNLPPCPMECQRYHHPSPPPHTHTHTHFTPTLPHLICYMCCVLHTWTHTPHPSPLTPLTPHPSHPSPLTPQIPHLLLIFVYYSLLIPHPFTPHPHTPSHSQFPQCVHFVLELQKLFALLLRSERRYINPQLAIQVGHLSTYGYI